MATLPAILLTLAAISMGATVISIIIVIRSTREARSTIFPIVREEEAIRARRARWFTIVAVSLTALFLGGWLATTFRFTSSDQITQVTETVETKQPEPTFTPEPTSTQIVIIVDQTATVTATPSPLPTETAVPTQPLEPSPTAAETETTEEAETGEEVEIALPAGVTVGPIQFATAVNDNVEPVNPQESFTTDIENIYAVFPYRGMENGLDVKAVWYQNGVELLRNESEWEWGSQGRFYTWIRPPGQGEYKLEVYVNDSVLATGLFEIR